YAGRADDLSLAVTVPALARAAREQSTLSAAVRAAMPLRPAGPVAPVFGTIEGGLTRLVDAVVRAAGARLLLGLPVRELGVEGTGWRLTLGPTPQPTFLHADAVVLAIPARPAARLLRGVN